jgi:putative tail protein
MGALFGPKPQTQEQEVYAGIQVSASIYGGAIPLVYGRQRLPFNLLWYGNFTATQGSSPGKGGGGNGSYTYSAAFIAGLCEGPIADINQVWHDKALESLYSENLSLSLGGTAPPIWPFLTSYTPPSVSITGYIIGNTLFASAVTGGTLQEDQAVSGAGVAAGTIITDMGAAGGGPGAYTVNISQTVGSASAQVAMTGAQGATGSQAIPYADIAIVATPGYNLGGSAGLPNLTFETDALLGYDAGSGMFDSDPSAFIPDYLTNAIHGAGFQGTIAPLTGSTNSWQAYVMSLVPGYGMLLSPKEDTQRQASSFLQDVMQVTNSAIFLSGALLKIMPYGDTPISNVTQDGAHWSWTPNLTPIFSFTDSDYSPHEGEEPVMLTRKPRSETFNNVNIEYVDRSNYYNVGIVNANDLGDITASQVRTMSTVSMHMITRSDCARVAAQLILNTSLYERNQYKFRVRADYCLLEPMDPIAITDSALGLVNQVCRIDQIVDSADDIFEITATEIPGTVRNTPLYNWQSMQAFIADYGASPGSVQPPMFFVMPPAEAAQAGGITLGIAVAGASSNAAWGGAHVYCCVDGTGTRYDFVGTVGAQGPARYGTTASTLPQHGDPDTADTLTVQLADTQTQLDVSVTDADADDMRTLCLVDSGANAEIIAYGNGVATMTPGQYQLNYLRRGVFGSNNVSHASGVPFARIDGAIFQLPFDAGYAGRTLSFKFISFNIYGKQVEDISAVPTYSYTFPVGAPVAGNARLIPRGSCVLVDENVYKATISTAGWNSDCVSASTFLGGCQAIAKYGQGLNVAFGLASSVAGTRTNSNIDYCWVADPANAAYHIYESGVLQTTVVTTPTNGDALQVIYDGFWIRYYLRGTLERQVPAALNKAFYLAAAMYDPGDTLSSVEFTALAAATPSQFLATGTCVVNDTHAFKQGGVTAWDSCVYSLTGFATCHIVAKWNALTDQVMVGLSSQPQTSPNYTNANYAWYNNSGTYYIHEGSNVYGPYGSVALNDQVKITYDGTTITYTLNGNAVATRTVVAPGQVLFGFCPMENPGAGLNSLSFGPTTLPGVVDAPQIGTNAATDVSAVSITSVGVPTTSSVTIGTITIGPYPAQTEVIVTAFGTWNFTAIRGTDGGIVEVGLGESTAVPSGNFVIAGQAMNLTTGQSLTGQFATEQPFTIPAGTTQTFYLVGGTLGGGTTGFTVSNIMLKAEVIKK